MSAVSPVVLAVDDDEEVLETYRIWLYDECTVQTATSGDEALEMIDDEVDIVLLDRMMSGMSGGQVLEEIRDRDVDCQVIIVSAVDPSFDVIDLDFDAYLAKPLNREELVEAIENATRRAEQPPEVREFLRDLATMEVLRKTRDERVLEENDRYDEFVDQLETERAKYGDTVDGDPVELVQGSPG